MYICVFVMCSVELKYELTAVSFQYLVITVTHIVFVVILLFVCEIT